MLQIVIQNVSCFSCCVPTTSPALHLSHSAGLDSPLHSVMRYRYSLYTSPTVQTLTAFCTPLFVIVIRYTEITTVFLQCTTSPSPTAQPKTPKCQDYRP